MVAKRQRQRVPQSGILSIWSLHVLRETRLVGVPARRTQPRANDLTGVRLEQTFNPNNPVHLEKQCKCYVDIDG